MEGFCRLPLSVVKEILSEWTSRLTTILNVDHALGKRSGSICWRAFHGQPPLTVIARKRAMHGRTLLQPVQMFVVDYLVVALEWEVQQCRLWFLKRHGLAADNSPNKTLLHLDVSFITILNRIHQLHDKFKLLGMFLQHLNSSKNIIVAFGRDWDPHVKYAREGLAILESLESQNVSLCCSLEFNRLSDPGWLELFVKILDTKVLQDSPKVTATLTSAPYISMEKTVDRQQGTRKIELMNLVEQLYAKSRDVSIALTELISSHDVVCVSNVQMDWCLETTLFMLPQEIHISDSKLFPANDLLPIEYLLEGAYAATLVLEDVFHCMPMDFIHHATPKHFFAVEVSARNVWVVTCKAEKFTTSQKFKKETRCRRIVACLQELDIVKEVKWL